MTTCVLVRTAKIDFGFPIWHKGLLSCFRNEFHRSAFSISEHQWNPYLTKMKFLTGIVLLALLVNTTVLFDFNENADISSWRVVDDVVMGGKSSGNFELSPEGHALFYGDVSLENGGGFSSVRYRFNGMTVTPDTKVRLRLMGDGKPYQLLVKHDVRSYYSYRAEFQTTGEWQDVEITLNEMKPEFRGNFLNQPNFDHNQIQEIHIQIANGKEESFRLLIDEIVLLEE